MRAAVALRGRATGTREIDVLDPRHLDERIDALLLAGGSAYGLGAADGVMRWLRERGRGLPVGPFGTIPIVPAAVIFDLGNSGKPLGWPGPDDGYRACENATADFDEGLRPGQLGETARLARTRRRLPRVRKRDRGL